MRIQELSKLLGPNAEVDKQTKNYQNRCDGVFGYYNQVENDVKKRLPEIKAQVYKEVERISNPSNLTSNKTSDENKVLSSKIRNSSQHKTPALRKASSCYAEFLRIQELSKLLGPNAEVDKQTKNYQNRCDSVFGYYNQVEKEVKELLPVIKTMAYKEAQGIKSSHN